MGRRSPRFDAVAAGLGFRVFRFRVLGFGLGVFRFRSWGLGFSVWGLGFGFWVSLGLGFGV